MSHHFSLSQKESPSVFALLFPFPTNSVISSVLPLSAQALGLHSQILCFPLVLVIELGCMASLVYWLYDFQCLGAKKTLNMEMYSVAEQ